MSLLLVTITSPTMNIPARQSYYYCVLDVPHTSDVSDPVRFLQQALG